MQRHSSFLVSFLTLLLAAPLPAASQSPANAGGPEAPPSLSPGARVRVEQAASADRARWARPIVGTLVRMDDDDLTVRDETGVEEKVARREVGSVAVSPGHKNHVGAGALIGALARKIHDRTWAGAPGW